MKAKLQKAKIEPDTSALMDILRILVIVAAVPAYVLLISLITITALPICLLTAEINRGITRASHFPAVLETAGFIQ